MSLKVTNNKKNVENIPEPLAKSFIIYHNRGKFMKPYANLHVQQSS